LSARTPSKVSAASLPEILAVGRDRGLKTGNEEPGKSASHILSLYTKGGPRYELDGRRFNAIPPFAILIPEGTVDHDVQVGEVEGTFVLFQGRGLLTAARSGQVSVQASSGTPPVVAPFLRHLSATDAVRLRNLLERMEGATPRHQQGVLLRAALLLEALALYCARQGPGRSAGVHREAQRLRDLIDAHAFEVMPMSRLYRELAVSAAQAATLFTRAFGVPPVAYRQQLRLNRAREILISTRRNVRETSWDVGFSDPLYFSRAFTKHFGTSPSTLIREFAVTRRSE
jgi:AraC-like DNA-binding protein